MNNSTSGKSKIRAHLSIALFFFLLLYSTYRKRIRNTPAKKMGIMIPHGRGDSYVHVYLCFFAAFSGRIGRRDRG